MNDQPPIDQPGTEHRLDRAAAALRAQTPDEAETTSATRRVWSSLEKELNVNPTELAIEGCDGYQDLIPAYLAGELSAGRRLLFEDHSRSCVACRRALAEARAETHGVVPQTATQARRERAIALPRWAMAAALVLAAGLAGLGAWQILGPAPVLAQVEAADGGLFQIDAAGASALAAGESVIEGTVIRTGRSAGSILRLADGSRLEIAPRSELSLSRRLGDTSVQVARGDIIVEATDQGSGHLFVNTEECEVAVTGTVFSVAHGTRGSRVSVIEGQVRVKQGAQEQLLQPGDQIATDPDMVPVPLADQFAWSRFSEEHMTLLREELAELGEELDALPLPAPRFGTTLAGELPADTAVFIGLPNLTGTLAEANALVESRVAESEVLSAWWDANMRDSEGEADIQQLITHLVAVGEQVGDEIVLAMAVGEDGEPTAPILMGGVADPESFRRSLTDEFSDFARELGEDLPLRFVDDPSQVPLEPSTEPPDEGEEIAPDAALDTYDDPEQLWVWVDEDRFAMTPDPAGMSRLAAGGTLAGSDFHAAIERGYAEGVDWLFAVDMPRLVTQALAEADVFDDAGAMRRSGLADARYLVVRQVERETHTDTSAELSFDGPRQGMAGWLAEPAPMGALDFIAPDAHVAAAFVTRAPAEIFDEMLSFIEATDADALRDVEEAQAEVGLDIRSALAEPLGGEFAFAMDGPLLPEPAWKLVVEVYDSARLQATLEDMVARSEQIIAEGIERGEISDEVLTDEELPRLELSQETTRGRTYHILREASSGLEMHYTYADGYMVAASSRAMIDRAIQYRSSGVNLRTAPNFDALLAAGDDLNVSALMYQNLAPIAKPVGEFLADRVQSESEMAPDQAAILGQAADIGEMPATLAYVYALSDRLVFSGRSDGGPLGIGLGSILGMEGLIGAPHNMGLDIAPPATR